MEKSEASHKFLHRTGLRLVALTFESQKQRLASDEEDCFYAMQLASSSVFPMVMQAAIELGLLDIIFGAGSGAYLSPV